MYFTFVVNFIPQIINSSNMGTCSKILLRFEFDFRFVYSNQILLRFEYYLRFEYLCKKSLRFGYLYKILLGLNIILS